MAALYRRLGTGPVSGASPEGHDGAEGHELDYPEDDPDTEIPGWIPDGLPTAERGWRSVLRADPGRAGGIALAIIAALAVLITVFTVVRQRPAPVASANLPPVAPVVTPVAASGPGPAPDQELIVSVVGLVHQPGLVTLTPNARVGDAVAAAGGALHGADTVGLNLARHLADGEQIVVGLATPAGQRSALGSSVGESAGTGPPPQTPSKAAGPVDLNTASVEDLDALPGVGPITAAAIVAWRSANGRFVSIDQLGEVDGIGPARLEKLRPLVRV